MILWLAEVGVLAQVEEIAAAGGHCVYGWEEAFGVVSLIARNIVNSLLRLPKEIQVLGCRHNLLDFHVHLLLIEVDLYEDLLIRPAE